MMSRPNQPHFKHTLGWGMLFNPSRSRVFIACLETATKDNTTTLIIFPPSVGFCSQFEATLQIELRAVECLVVVVVVVAL